MLKKKILLLDNHDSFTYNLVQLVEQHQKHDLTTCKTDEIELDTIKQFDKILISPGPGIPNQIENLQHIMDKYAKTKDFLGICLGHQALAEYFGATLQQMPKPIHGGKKAISMIQNDIIFKDIPQHTHVGLYHSWRVASENLPDALQVTAISSDGVIMAFKHRNYQVRGVQFHPESIITTEGKKMIFNWLSA